MSGVKGGDSNVEFKFILFFINMQFASNPGISCQATRSVCYLYEFRIKKHDFFRNFSLVI